MPRTAADWAAASMNAVYRCASAGSSPIHFTARHSVASSLRTVFCAAATRVSGKRGGLPKARVVAGKLGAAPAVVTHPEKDAMVKATSPSTSPADPVALAAARSKAVRSLNSGTDFL